MPRGVLSYNSSNFSNGKSNISARFSFKGRYSLRSRVGLTRECLLTLVVCHYFLQLDMLSPELISETEKRALRDNMRKL